MTINKTSPDANVIRCKVQKIISVSYNNPKVITILAQMALSYTIYKNTSLYREMTTVVKTMLQDIVEMASVDMINEWVSVRKKWMMVWLSLEHMAMSLYWHNFEKVK
jgi:hypothetical protein